MIADVPFQTHDLVRFSTVSYEDLLPEWADRLGRDAWAVVRRHEPTHGGMIAVGLRGRERAERLAIEIYERDVVRRVTPEALVLPNFPELPAPGIREALEAIAASSAGWLGMGSWGPTGSVGFQLATGLPAVRESSDLDLILRAQEVIAPADALEIVGQLHSQPCRVDCLIETPSGAVALTEWAHASGRAVLLRTSRGPVLTENPWSEQHAAPVFA